MRRERPGAWIFTAVIPGASNTDTLLLAALIVFTGYLVFGVTGFGASPITVPVLAHFLPLPFVLSLAAALDLGSAAALGLTRGSSLMSASCWCWRRSRSSASRSA